MQMSNDRHNYIAHEFAIGEGSVSGENVVKWAGGGGRGGEARVVQLCKQIKLINREERGRAIVADAYIRVQLLLLAVVFCVT